MANGTPVTPTKALTEAPKPSLLRTMAERYGVEPSKMQETLLRTVFPKAPSQEQFIAFLLVANQYELNPFTREIYAFPQGSGVVPIVPIDGWVSIVQRHPQYDGVEQTEAFDDDGVDIISVTTKFYRKDQSRPTILTEYYDECRRDTEPWKKWPVRMLRHKSYIQCARYAFGLSGIYDPDEVERVIEVESIAPTNGQLPAEIKRASEITKEPPTIDADAVAQAQANLEERRKEPPVDEPPPADKGPQGMSLDFGSIVG